MKVQSGYTFSIGHMTVDIVRREDVFQNYYASADLEIMAQKLQCEFEMNTRKITFELIAGHVLNLPSIVKLTITHDGSIPGHRRSMIITLHRSEQVDAGSKRAK